MKTAQLPFLIMIFSLTFFTCKKKEETPTETPTPVVTDAADTYRGFMISSTYTIIVDSLNQSWQTVEGRFHQKPVKNYGGGNDIDLKYIAVNGSPLTNENMFIYTFKQRPSNLDLSTDTWVVNDTNGIMTFTYTNKTPFPSVKDTKVLPDVASSTVACSFKIESVSNFDIAYFSITNGGTVTVSFPLTAGDNQITISPAQLQSIGTGTASTIGLYLSNTTVKSFFGKNYQFSKQVHFSKPFRVQP